MSVCWMLLQQISVLVLQACNYYFIENENSTWAQEVTSKENTTIKRTSRISLQNWNISVEKLSLVI